MVNGVVFIALLSRMVGVTEFAEWNWLQSSIGLFLITDFYLFIALQNRITVNFVEQKQAKSAQLASNLLFIELTLSVALIGAVALFYFVIFPDMNSAIRPELVGLFCFAMVVSLLGMPFSIVGAYYSGLGDTDYLNNFYLVKTVLQNIFILLMLWWGVSFQMAAGLFFVVGLAMLLGLHFYGIRRYNIRFRRISRKTMAITMALMLKGERALYWGMLRVGEAVRQNLSLFAGFFFLPAVAIADYALISRANSVVAMVASSVMTPMIPRLLVLQTNNDRDGITRITHKMLYAISIYGVFSIAFFTLFAGPIISMWSGRTITYDRFYVFLIALSGVFQVLQLVFWNLLVGLNKIRALMYFSLSSTVVLAIVFYGAIGRYAELAMPLTIIASALFFVGSSIWYLRMRHLVGPLSFRGL